MIDDELVITPRLLGPEKVDTAINCKTDLCIRFPCGVRMGWGEKDNMSGLSGLGAAAVDASR